MSPKSRGRKQKPTARRGGSKKRRSQRRRSPDPIKSLLAFGRDLRKTADPLEAEVLASGLAAIWWDSEQPASAGDDDLGEVARRKTAESLALLLAVAAVAPPHLARAAEAGAQQLQSAGLLAPVWARRIGRVRPGPCYLVTDVFGDISNVLCVFSYDGVEHAISVLVDHSLFRIAKDALAGPDAEEIVGFWRGQAAEDEQVRFEEIAPATARALIEQALARTDDLLHSGLPITEELRRHRALVLARMRVLPEPAELPAPPEWDAGARTALMERFLASDHAPAVDADVARECAAAIVEHGCDADFGQPQRVSPSKTEFFLTGWLPEIVPLSPEAIEAMPAVLQAWVRWSAEATGLPADARDEVLTAVEEFGPELATAYDGVEAETVELITRLVGDDDVPRSPAALAELASRRMLAVPAPEGTYDGLDLSLLNLHDEDERGILLESMHPEWADVLDDVAVDEVEGVSPHLHLALHQLVSNQLWQNEPPEVWQAAQRVLDARYDDHNVHHALMFALSEPLDRVQAGEPFDLEEYRARLAELPANWQAAFPEAPHP